MGVEPPNAGLVAEEASLGARRDSHRLRAAQDSQGVRRVVELLVAGDVTREALADNSWNALATEGQLRRLAVHGRQDLRPRLLTPRLSLLNECVFNHCRERVLGVGFGEPLQRRVVGLVRSRPGGGEGLRVVRGAPRLAEGQVEIARHHRLIQLVFGQAAGVHSDADLGEVGDNVVFDGDGRRVALVHDEVKGEGVAVLQIVRKSGAREGEECREKEGRELHYRGR
mmetsp:Transcript_32753/g.70822  ORF Transcript_32753/g.70822 Transcript_32753/m.70822 type:complete len:226 (+) Transcript_32753:1138-1815(+)